MGIHIRPVQVVERPTRVQIDVAVGRARDVADSLAPLYETRRSLSIPCLRAVQETLGWIPPEAMGGVGRVLGLSGAEVQAVATFYTMFFTSPPGRFVIDVCGTISCALGGADAVLKAFEEALGVPVGGTTPDGLFTLRRVECLGWCHKPVVAQVNESDFIDGLTPAAARDLVERLRRGATEVPGPSAEPDVRPLEGYAPTLLARYRCEDPVSLRAAERAGRYAALQKARGMAPAAVVEEVKAAGLCGRGGAGFSTGLKWDLCAQARTQPRYVVVNADESEPGTFKDVQILEHDPHLMIEGAAIAAHAIGAKAVYIYLRGEFTRAARILARAIAEAAPRLGDLRLVLHRGAGAYICGEETALLESLEGKIGEPRLKPPFPVTHGLWARPTVVQNVETLAAVPEIVLGGASAFRARGVAGAVGSKLFCVSGRVERPGVFEAPLGTTLRRIVYEFAGGPLPGRRIRGAFPGGSSAPPLAESEFDVPMDFKPLAEKGSMLGSAAVIVFDDAVSAVEIARNAMRFYAHESCGKCTPCRDGTHFVHLRLASMLDGRGRPEDLPWLDEMSRRVFADCFCPLAKGAMWALGGTMKRWRPAFEALARGDR